MVVVVAEPFHLVVEGIGGDMELIGRFIIKIMIAEDWYLRLLAEQGA